MPTRSRMVLLYSALLRRRMVTRPGSLGPLQSTLKTATSIQVLRASNSCMVGCGLPCGGIVEERRLSATFSHSLRFFSAVASSVNCSKLTLPRFLVALWQLRQYFARIG